MTARFPDRLWFVLMLIALLLTACGGAPPEPTLTPTVADTATDTPVPTATLTPSPTLTPTETLTPTSTPNIAATQKYDALQAQLEQLVKDKIIPSMDGTYYALDDYSKEFAKIRYYTWDLYDGAQPSNFVVQAKVKIANATTENAFKSGCGFVFANFFDNHAVFFALDGNANYWDNGYDRGSKYLDNTVYEKNPDGVVITLVLYNKALHFYVNGREALKDITIYGEPFTVGPAVLSGTSEGFGTRCEFTEMALWEIK